MWTQPLSFSDINDMYIYICIYIYSLSHGSNCIFTTGLVRKKNQSGHRHHRNNIYQDCHLLGHWWSHWEHTYSHEDLRAWFPKTIVAITWRGVANQQQSGCVIALGGGDNKWRQTGIETVNSWRFGKCAHTQTHLVLASLQCYWCDGCPWLWIGLIHQRVAPWKWRCCIIIIT